MSRRKSALQLWYPLWSHPVQLKKHQSALAVHLAAANAGQASTSGRLWTDPSLWWDYKPKKSGWSTCLYQPLPCIPGTGAASFATTTTASTHPAREGVQGVRGNIDVIPISSSVRTLCQQGKLKEAFSLLDNMDKVSFQGRIDTYCELIQGCAKFKALEVGKQVHAHMISKGLEPTTVIENLLITMFSKCGSVEEARKIFDKMPKRNVVAWTAITSGVAQEEGLDAAVQHLYLMQKEDVKPDAVYFMSILNAVASSRDIVHGKLIHLQIVQCGLQGNIYVANALISMYARCESVQDAREVFDKMTERDIISWTTLLALYCRLGYVVDAQKTFDIMPMRDIVSWSAMIAGHASHGRSEDAFELLHKMQEAGVNPDKVTFLSILNACKNPRYLERGRQIHANINKARFDTDVRLGNALVKMYTKCGSLADARQVFDKMTRKDVISWTALLNTYIKFKQIKEARDVFDKMPNRDVICWNSMISGYCKLGEAEKALELFHQMEKENIAPDDKTYVGVLNACANKRSLQQGLDIHSRVLISGHEGDLYVQNALIDMYIKCGSLNTAVEFFEKMPKRDVVSWNSMLFGLIHSGQRKQALELFKRMQADTIRPDSLTFLGVLSACKKEGLIAEGSKHFLSMKRDFKIKPTMKHYSLLDKESGKDKSQPANSNTGVPKNGAEILDQSCSLETEFTEVKVVGVESTHGSQSSI